MKQISHYLPFFVLTILLYGWFFYHHNQSTIILPVPLNSGQQVVDLQLLEMDGATEETETPVQKESTVKKEIIIKKESAVKKEIIVKKESAVKTAPATLLVSDLDTQMPAEIKNAHQTLQKTIEETAASSTAMLKAELFEADLDLDLPNRPAPKKTTPKGQTNAPSIISEILQAQEKSKRIFKKEPQTSVSSKIDGVVLQEAIVVSGNKPLYPERAILRNQQGRVVVKLTVTTKGKATETKILTSSGHAVLDDAVLDFIKNELFMPAHQGEEKITTQQIFSFRFELK